jgi:hypothetical protein
MAHDKSRTVVAPRGGLADLADSSTRPLRQLCCSLVFVWCCLLTGCRSEQGLPMFETGDDAYLEPFISRAIFEFSNVDHTVSFEYAEKAEVIDLPPGQTYTLSVRFDDRRWDPPVDFTESIRSAAEEYLLFFTGSAVVGPATSNETGPLIHSYADVDANGLPLGLTNTIETVEGSGGLFLVMVRLAEPKSLDLLDQVKRDGPDGVLGEHEVRIQLGVVVR